jgi:hypothetical protein
VTAWKPAAAIAVVALVTGCGQSVATTVTAAAPAAPSLDFTVGTTSGTWAVVVMGGSAAQYDNFWQLFVQPAGSSRWSLVTPPGTADNGGLAVAAAGGRPLITAFRPSQDLTYTPLIQTGDGGKTWASLNPLAAKLAASPDALAAAQGTGSLVALLDGGDVEQSTAPGYAGWSTLTSRAALAATAAGRQCGLSALTAAAVTRAGTVLLGGVCTRRGVAGIFAAAGGAWRLAGPLLPAGLSGEDVTVLRLTQTSHGTAALLAAGSGAATTVVAAWSADDGARWTTSRPFSVGTAVAGPASFGPDGTVAIILGAGRGETLAGTQPAWRALPAGTAALAAGPDGGTEALAVHRSVLTVWQLGDGGSTWVKAQTINVPIQYGSSA